MLQGTFFFVLEKSFNKANQLHGIGSGNELLPKRYGLSPQLTSLLPNLNTWEDRIFKKKKKLNQPHTRLHFA